MQNTEEQTQEALFLFRKILEIPSVNGQDNEGAVADYISQYFRQHGVASHVIKIDSKHANVIADIPGKRNDDTIIWNGHLDTVPYGDLSKWVSNPAVVTVRGDRLYGRGASDMKSGLSAMVYALTHLLSEPSCNIRFIGTCDEEKYGIGAAAARDQGMTEGCRFILIGEPTGMKLGTAHKGCLWLKITLHGQTSHGAYPEKGVNAIHCFYTLAERIVEYVSGFSHPVLGRATAQIDMIRGGMAPNMTADLCEGVLDIRMVPGLTTGMVLDFARAILDGMQETRHSLTAEFTVLTDRRAFDIDPEEEHVKVVRSLIRNMGYEGTDRGINFFTDASVFAADDMDAKVLLFGPGEPEMAHQANEYVEIKKYLDAIEVFKKFACE